MEQKKKEKRYYSLSWDNTTDGDLRKNMIEHILDLGGEGIKIVMTTTIQFWTKENTINELSKILRTKYPKVNFYLDRIQTDKDENPISISVYKKDEEIKKFNELLKSAQESN